ncbi:MAG TPA: hypothetical protein VN213_01990, partial [Solirubrobacteraceae bacterium]|nr:hypothetical protein [Solirubrobacteraceae bacterium]
MRILYLLTHTGLFRNFESTLRLLAERGHEVRVALDSDRYPSAAFEALLAAHPNVTRTWTPPVPDDGWSALGRAVRAASDYLRYLEPRYANAPKLRARARRQVPAWLRPAVADPSDPARVDRALRRIERGLPVREEALGFLREHEPDVVCITPLFGSAGQLEVLRAAKVAGVPTCLTVASWDNLSNKGLIREAPDAVAVWNDAQRREAAELQRLDSETVTVTGAQNFDEWFAREPATTAAQFTARIGLDPARPYLLYLGSSSFIAPDEAPFAAEWLRRLRASEDPRLREIGVLFRPHPQNARQWDRPDLLEDPRVAIHPPPASAPQQTGRADWSREDFYDSMFHAAAVIGVNTTAMIESAVLGRGVYTMLAPQFRETQEGTLHFEHLRSFAGGLLHLSESFDEHLADLAAALDRNGAPDERSRRFVEAFVRPHGLGRPATPILAGA